MLRGGYKTKEVIQWGYTAMVGIILALTTITGAAANRTFHEKRNFSSDGGQWKTCLRPKNKGELLDRQVCEMVRSEALDVNYGLNQVINSALKNTDLERDRSRYLRSDDSLY